MCSVKAMRVRLILAGQAMVIAVIAWAPVTIDLFLTLSRCALDEAPLLHQPTLCKSHDIFGFPNLHCSGGPFGSASSW